MNISKVSEFSGHAGAVYACDFDGKFIYSGSADKYITRWDIDKSKQDNFAVSFGQAVYSLKIVGKQLIAGLSNGHVHIFDLDTRKEIKFLTQHITGVFSIAHNSTLGHVYIADADGNLSVWKDSDYSQVIYQPLGCGKIRNILADEKNGRLVLACQNGEVKILDADGFNEIHSINGHRGGCTSVVQTSVLLVTGGKDAHLKIRDNMTYSELKSIPAHNFAIYQLITMADHHLLISASRDKSIKIWNAETMEFVGKISAEVGGHTHSVNDLVKIDENRFASCSDDGKIKIWEIKKR